MEADGVPLAARLAAAAKRHQYNARQVLELFFPLWDDHKTQHDTKALLPLEQVRCRSRLIIGGDVSQPCPTNNASNGWVPHVIQHLPPPSSFLVGCRCWMCWRWT